jgi:hypothetical protein
MEGFIKSGVFIGIVVTIFLINPLIIWGLWDNVMVKYFNLQDVTFVDSIFISILANVLFKNSQLSSKNN